MKRYLDLIKKADSEMGLRALSRALKMPVQSLNSYLQDGTEPRSQNLEKMAVYFGLPVAALLADTEDKDSNTDMEIFSLVHKLNIKQKQELKKHIRAILRG